jgi:hypothetical protein
VVTRDSTQINAKLSKKEKLSLLTLAKAKGCEGITGFLKLLASAKEVKITL